MTVWHVYGNLFLYLLHPALYIQYIYSTFRYIRVYPCTYLAIYISIYLSYLSICKWRRSCMYSRCDWTGIITASASTFDIEYLNPLPPRHMTVLDGIGFTLATGFHQNAWFFTLTTWIHEFHPINNPNWTIPSPCRPTYPTWSFELKYRCKSCRCCKSCKRKCSADLSWGFFGLSHNSLQVLIHQT